MKTHWHEHNPWAEQVVYVPIEELAECIAGGTLRLRDGTVVENTADRILSHWRMSGDKLDAYILSDIRDSRFNAIGVRFGPEGHDYHSPHNRNPEALDELLARYQATAPAP